MNLRNKKILITGGTGFIGSAIVNKLTSYYDDINILSRQKENFWRIENIKKCTFHKVDLANFKDIEKCVKKINPEIIFHLAGYITSERNFEAVDKCFRINYINTKNLLLSLNDVEYDLFLNTGTVLEYGNNKPPLKEDLREDPISPYSASKIFVTKYCELLANLYNKPIITVRPTITYGPKQIGRFLIPWLIFSGIEGQPLALTPCEQTRDFIFIDDVVDAYIQLSENYQKIRNERIFNISSGKGVKILMILDIIRNALKDANFKIGEKAYRSGEPMELYASIDKIKRITGWYPKWTIKDGLESTLNWWLNNRPIWIKYRHFYL